jgi:photosystem II stability/assembly factor-like uncharacterized protein
MNIRKESLMNTQSMSKRLPMIFVSIVLSLLLVIPNHSSPAAVQAAATSESLAAASTYVWQKVNTGLEDPFALQFSSNFGTNGQVYAFSDFNTLYVGHGYGAIFRSDTRGKTWENHFPPVPWPDQPPVLRLAAVSPETASGPVMLAVEDYTDTSDWTSYHRLVRSTSSSSGWTTVWDKSPLFNQIVFSPAFATDGIVFVTLADSPTGGIWKSTDWGVTWHPDQKIAVHPYNGRVISLVFSPNFTTDHTLMASVPSYWDGETTWPGGTYRSENGGTTWIPSDAGCLGRVWKLAFSPTYTTDQTVYAQGEDSSDLNNSRVYRSTDLGRNWVCLPNQPNAGAIFDIALSPAYASDHTLLLGTTGGGLVQSTNAGTSWQTLAWNGSGVQYAYFSPNYPNDHTLAVTLKGMQFGYNGPAGNFFSYDGGSSWQPAGIYPPPVNALALSPAYDTDRSLWASLGAGQGNAYRSTNAGDTWLSQFRWITYWPVFNSMAAVQKSGGGHLVFATTLAVPGNGGGVYLSSDGGINYYPTTGPTYGNVVVVSPGFASDHTVWVGAYYGLYYSVNSGTNWAIHPGDLPANNVIGLAVSPAYPTDHTLFAVVSSLSTTQLYRTTNSGTNWTSLALPGGAIPSKVSISPAYATDQTIWVSSTANGVFRSSNKGDSWQSPTTVLSGCGEVQPNGSSVVRLLWAVCSGNLYRSPDEGATWIQDGPAGVGATFVAAFPDGKTVFLGTADKGIYRRTSMYSVFLPFTRR